MTPSALPEMFSEIFVDVMMSSEMRHMGFTIPKIALTGTQKSFIGSTYPYRGTSVEIGLTDSRMTGANVLYYYASQNPTSYSETSTYTIYYR